jgi:hypothetical protein
MTTRSFALVIVHQRRPSKERLSAHQPTTAQGDLQTTLTKFQSLDHLVGLIASGNGPTVADAFRTFVPNDDARMIISETAKAVLQRFPTIPGACALMSATFCACLEQRLQAPIHVVAGMLTVNDEPVFGDGTPMDGNAVFGHSNLDWDGHAWVMVGPYVADISIFRTAYSSKSPLLLERHIYAKFGTGKGFYFRGWESTHKDGLGYHPQYVLSERQVISLLKGAKQVIEGG